MAVESLGTEAILHGNFEHASLSWIPWSSTLWPSHFWWYDEWQWIRFNQKKKKKKKIVLNILLTWFGYYDPFFPLIVMMVILNDVRIISRIYVKFQSQCGWDISTLTEEHIQKRKNKIIAGKRHFVLLPKRSFSFGKLAASPNPRGYLLALDTWDHIS